MYFCESKGAITPLVTEGSLYTSLNILKAYLIKFPFARTLAYFTTQFCWNVFHSMYYRCKILSRSLLPPSLSLQPRRILNRVPCWISSFVISQLRVIVPPLWLPYLWILYSANKSRDHASFTTSIYFIALWNYYRVTVHACSICRERSG